LLRHLEKEVLDIEELINEEENDNDKAADIDNIISDNEISKNGENAFEIMARNA